jgi:putative transcriptional regulator
MPKEKSIVANRIKEIRTEKFKISQDALAKRIGVSRQTIVAIEKGDYAPSLELAFRICYVFSEKVDDVFAFDPKKLKGGIEAL